LPDPTHCLTAPSKRIANDIYEPLLMRRDSTHPAALAEADLLRDCRSRRQRRSGPGGQHRNKVETAVVFTHLPTGIQGEATERRSQEQNRVMALFRMRVNLALGVRTEIDLAEQRASDLWVSRCRGGRLAINVAHLDFPPLLAEAMDVVWACAFDIKLAAERLAISSTQLVKLLQQEPRALQAVNHHRQEAGLRQLR